MADPPARPVDRLLGGYLLLTAPVLLFPHRPDVWPVLFLAHLGVGALLIVGAAAPLRAPGQGRFVRVLGDWYPLLLMPALYLELPMLNGSLWGGHFFDDVIQNWEARLFGGQPSATLAMRWSWPPLSELLHLAYLAYYPLIYVFPSILYARREWEPFRATVFALMLGFTVSYVIFTAFPVQGPRYLFPSPGGDLAGGWFYRLTHTVLETGSSQGAAFPSSHAAIAVIQTVSAMRYLPRAAPLLGLITAGIAVGAVYGGFHYGIDMLAGLLLGAVVAGLSPFVRKSLA